ncbi:lytic transglycosylase domain-containing protein [Shewanella avicenniae]|uniref:Lytic transglycosylase domain-containing protein n=1 Tax=Shewanella avicenniae TaxID=2814294 RepID=A0ABX7QSZ6_9GAMM|nr:lytic transglycosylase domain-containing protein [Shewanella avicenniae]
MLLTPPQNPIAACICSRHRRSAALLGCSLLLLNCMQLHAEDSQERVFRYKNAKGVVVFSDQQPENQPFEVLLYDCYACNPDSTVDWQHTPLFTEPYQQEINLAAAQHKLDPALIRAVIHAESAFNPAARSKTGAVGLMQLMPETAKSVGVSNRYNPQDNIDGGSRYLAKLLQRFNGNIQLACAAYNAGPTLVSQLGAVPDYPETQSYVKRVQILLQRYRQH